MKFIERHSLYQGGPTPLYLHKYSEVLTVNRESSPYMEVLADPNEPRVPVVIRPYIAGDTLPEDAGICIGSCSNGYGGMTHFFRSRWPE